MLSSSPALGGGWGMGCGGGGWGGVTVVEASEAEKKKLLKEEVDDARPGDNLEDRGRRFTDSNLHRLLH